MPKPNLSAMSINDLLKLREDLNEVLEHKADQLRDQLSKLSVAADYKQKGSLIGRKVPPKYRSSSGETWAGRGAKPRWLVAAMKKGKKLDDFLIKRRAKR